MPKPDVAQEQFVLLGERVRRIREGAGLSQSQLATKAGISRTSLHMVEAGTGNPRYGTLLALADALGIGIHVLIPRG
ncbi:MAG: transcriptional regulator, family [Thermoleophilia bacterium]|nr:transcriptional regulator, family [Thermoleophilia bacterium]